MSDFPIKNIFDFLKKYESNAFTEEFYNDYEEINKTLSYENQHVFSEICKTFVNPNFNKENKIFLIKFFDDLIRGKYNNEIRKCSQNMNSKNLALAVLSDEDLEKIFKNSGFGEEYQDKYRKMKGRLIK